MRLHPRAVRAQQVRDALAGVATICVVLALATLVPAIAAWPWSLPVAVGIAAVAAASTLVEVLVVEPRANRAFTYELTDTAVDIHRGVLVEVRQHVPHRQVLVVERRVGPVLRAFGLIAVRLRLPEGMVDIYGIDDGAYERIRATVLAGRDDG